MIVSFDFSGCRDFSFFFFFQAEDGIRDDLVTGVQTCALPISAPVARLFLSAPAAASRRGGLPADQSAEPRSPRQGRFPRGRLRSEISVHRRHLAGPCPLRDAPGGMAQGLAD